MAKKSFLKKDVNSLDYWPRLGIQIIAGIGISILIVRFHDLALTNSFEIWMLAIIGLAALLISPFYSKDNNERELYALFIAHVLWILTYIFLLPADTPFILISFLLIYLVTLQLNVRYVYISAASLILATVLSALTTNPQTAAVMITALVVSVSLFVIAVLASQVIENKKVQQAEIAEKTKESTLAKERLQSLINSMADAVIATDSSGHVVVYNGAALDILNINVSLEHKLLNDYLHLKNAEGKTVDIFKLSQKSRAYLTSSDLHIDYDDGDRIALYISIAQVRIGYGKQGEQGYILLMRDITSEKSLEEERDEFISVVSHELRTPITIAEGNISNVQLLVKGHENDMSKIQKSLDEAHQQVIFLSEMINDLSTLSRAESKQLTIDAEKIDVKELIDSLKDDYDIEMKQKSLELRFIVEKDVEYLVTSRLYLREIIQNFITNAIKYTPTGFIELRVEQTEVGVRFSVIDSGIGISKSDQKKLFNKFFRSEDYRTRESSGTGLGLYVTKKLCKLLDADIEIKSELNKGSTFSILVPDMDLDSKKSKD